MQLPAAKSLDRFAGWLALLLACLLLLAVPGLGQPSPPRWRVAEEEEHHPRDTSGSAAWVAAEGLRLRGRAESSGQRPPRYYVVRLSSRTPAAGASRLCAAALQLAAGVLNGCGAFLRC